ncbi:MAG: hypothetical protein AB1486_02185 [Planctomycetota bacterium]
MMRSVLLIVVTTGGCLAGCVGAGEKDLAPSHSSSSATEAMVPPVERVPAAQELAGVWRSVAISGDLDEMARSFLYAIQEDGSYTAAVLVDAEGGYEWLTLAGTYEYEGGVLDLGGGSPSFTVRERGDVLVFRSSHGELLLRAFLDDSPGTVAPVLADH